MTYIHLKPDWPDFTWDMATLAYLLADVRLHQGKILGQMEILGFDLKSEAMLKALTDDLVESFAIEGERLNSETVRSSFARSLGIPIDNPKASERDVDGVVEMMLNASQRYNEALSKDRLFGWHAALFPTGRSGMQKIPVGRWRDEAFGPMQVVSGAIGHEKVHFEAPRAERLEVEMTAFLNWFNQQNELDPFIKAGLSHIWFETLHPFADGNGRIGRAIADLALCRADGTANRYYSLSAQINKDRNGYYKALEDQQKNGLDATYWLEWFLSSVLQSMKSSQETLSAILFKARFWQWLAVYSINDRQRLVLNKMLGAFEGHMNTSKYAKLVKCSKDTALRDIQSILQIGAFIQNSSGGRSTSYRLLTSEELQQKTARDLTI